ncbi:MAG: N-acetylmuramoyl-L-alanine amidase [Phycisphaeraceae bacterium]|nr:N-acetylmuramoyl-L-alanine amidase [Phycisphaeraceae bacterium]
MSPRIGRHNFVRFCSRVALRCAIAISIFVVEGCESQPKVGSELRRTGDEIVIAGRLIHTGAPVVLWTDPGGYDGYRTEKRFAPPATPTGNKAQQAEPAARFDSRAKDSPLAETTHGGNWSLNQLRGQIDQIVLHYDASGTSRQCFRTLHDVRGLSIHFMVDLDGTIYQTLDVKERAWHATKSNSRSIGIEIANIGAYPSESPVLEKWYTRDERGLYVTLPPEFGDGGIRTPGFVARPRRSDFVRGEVHGQILVQADYTAQQYASLASLLAALHIALPEIPLESPRGPMSTTLSRCLTDEEWAEFKGVLGHSNIQRNKIDPGPALDWDFLLWLARKKLDQPIKFESVDGS